MARKKKLQDLLELTDESCEASTQCCQNSAECEKEAKYKALVDAAQALVDNFTAGHDIKTIDDYRYLKPIVLALQQIS